MWLAAQEGFAGELVEEDGWFEWRRDIDFQPKAIYSDIGRLWIEGDVMVEEGKDIPYIEHWHREPIGSMPLWAARLEDRETGQKGAIARMGSLFMIARERYCAVPEGLTLAECVAGAADMARAQEFLDCEISQGAVTSTGWFVQRSSLPFREGKSLAPARMGDLFEMQDQDRAGKPFTRRWDIARRVGASDLPCIPVIDIAPLFGKDEEAKMRVAAEMADAASNVGFLYVKGHNIPREMIEKLEARAAEFFARPLEEKMDLYIGKSRAHRGYVPTGEEGFYDGTDPAKTDKKEAFDLSIELPEDDPDHVKGYRMLGPNQWPADMPEMQRDVYAYYEAAMSLGHTIFGGFARALG